MKVPVKSFNFSSFGAFASKGSCCIQMMWKNKTINAEIHGFVWTIMITLYITKIVIAQVNAYLKCTFLFIYLNIYIDFLNLSVTQTWHFGFTLALDTSLLASAVKTDVTDSDPGGSV